MIKIRHFILLSFTTLILIACGNPQNDYAPQSSIKVLAWVGYEEAEIVEPFKKEFGIDVQVETFTGADKMFAKLSQDPDGFDVVVIDPEYIKKLNDAQLIQSLDASKFKFDDYIEPLKKFELSWIDGELKAVLVRFGINALVYNTDKLTAEEVSSYNVLMSPKVKGRVGIWDWYLPNMGLISLLNGNESPYVVNDKQSSELANTLETLRPQVRAFLSSFSEVNSALARGDVWVVPAHGEHTAAVLAEQGLPIAWTVPKEGAIMWVETLGIPTQAKNKEGAIKFIRYVQRPETLAKLTWRRAYRSNTPSAKAIDLLTAEQKILLHVQNSQDAASLVNMAHVRYLPASIAGKNLENEWQAMWQSFKAQTE